MGIAAWVVGSLRAAAKAEVLAKQRRNPAAVANRYSFLHRVARHAYSKVRAGPLLIGYILLALAIEAGVVANDFYCRSFGALVPLPSFLKSSQELIVGLRDISGFLIASQIGLLGVIAIAVALVTLLGDRNETRMHTRAYFSQTMVRSIAESTGALLVVLTIQVFWPLDVLRKELFAGPEVVTGPVSLSAIQAVWGAVNLGATTYFVVLSLAYANPDERQRHVMRFQTNVSHPRELARRIAGIRFRELLSAYITMFPAKRIGVYAASYFPGAAVVRAPKGAEWELVDVWQRPLKFALKRWLESAHVSHTGSYPSPFISFPTMPGQRLLSGQAICIIDGITPPKAWQRFVIRCSHRLRRKSW